MLAEVWNEAVIDQHPVVCEWRGVAHEDVNFLDQKWFSEHVRSSQFFLQIVNCDLLLSTPQQKCIKSSTGK